MKCKIFMLPVLSVSGWSQPEQRQAQPPIVLKVEMPPTAHRDWIDLLEAFGPLVAVGVALIVGGTQLALQKRQLNMDLFEKRYRVYKATHDFAAEASKWGARTDPETDKSFANDTAHAEFLFDRDVQEFIGSIRSITKKLTDVERELAVPFPFPTEKESEAKVKLRHQLMSEMNQELTRMNQVFRPYFRHRSWYSRL